MIPRANRSAGPCVWLPGSVRPRSEGRLAARALRTVGLAFISAFTAVGAPTWGPGSSPGALSQAGFDGDRFSRVCLSEKQGPLYVTSQEVPTKVVRARHPGGARVWSADCACHGDLGVPAESLGTYVRQVEANEGLRPDLPTAGERDEIKRAPLIPVAGRGWKPSRSTSTNAGICSPSVRR